QADRAGGLEVSATIPGDDGPAVRGALTFIDNKVDAATGTIRLRATFTNADSRLWPGQFVNLVLTVGVQPKAVVVPIKAVQAGQKGQHVFIVSPSGLAELRPVVVARTDVDNSIIEKGLEGGETVVIDGQLRLAPGVKVEAKSTPSAAKEADPT